jgi:uncharacterized protein
LTDQTAPDIIAQTADHIRDQFIADSSGHDWWHIYRVWQTALYIGQQEGADLTVVQLGALLHDIADWKFHNGDETVGPAAARAWLESLAVDPAIIEPVVDIVAHISFKGAGVPDTLQSLAGRVVQDADRLDAIGAVGIGRAFAYGGAKGRLMHDPQTDPQEHQSFEAYKAANGSTINHFYEKLLLLKDRMNTATGQRLAAERHQFMEQFLAQFFAEWNLH